MPISELIPIVSKKKIKKMPYDLWIEDNKKELIFVYKLIKNYDKDMDFLMIF